MLHFELQRFKEKHNATNSIRHEVAPAKQGQVGMRCIQVSKSEPKAGQKTHWNITIEYSPLTPANIQMQLMNIEENVNHRLEAVNLFLSLDSKAKTKLTPINIQEQPSVKLCIDVDSFEGATHILTYLLKHAPDVEAIFLKHFDMKKDCVSLQDIETQIKSHKADETHLGLIAEYLACGTYIEGSPEKLYHAGEIFSELDLPELAQICQEGLDSYFENINESINQHIHNYVKGQMQFLNDFKRHPELCIPKEAFSPEAITHLENNVSSFYRKIEAACNKRTPLEESTLAQFLELKELINDFYCKLKAEPSKDSPRY